MLRFAWTIRLVGCFGLLLMVATSGLWTPQQVFPQVPWFSFLVATPTWVDWLLLSVAMAGFGLMAVAAAQRNLASTGIWMASIGMFGLILLDQHRLQPWAYQMLIYCGLMLCLRPLQCLPAMRLVLVSIYFFSALSKFDYQFEHSVGQDMLGAIGNIVGWPIETLPEANRVWLARTFPAVELLAALLLLIPAPRWQTAGAMVASAMHVGLLLVLGPIGLNHLPGVLLWNVYFLFQVWILFPAAQTPVAAEDESEIASSSFSRLGTSLVGYCLVAVVIALPLLQPLGWCDHWPAWELYAPRTSRVELVLQSTEPIAIPTSPVVDRPAWGPEWVSVDFSRWSQETLNVPVYPQARFQYACARALVDDEQAAVYRVVQFRLLSASDRWTGTRESIESTDLDAAILVDRFWVNTSVRPHFRLQSQPQPEK